jgi:hypothetical protein
MRTVPSEGAGISRALPLGRPYHFAFVLVLAISISTTSFAQDRKVLADPSALANASPDLIGRLRADPFSYFRFVNRAWTARVCEVFADLQGPPIVRLHGDAHVEQFALTQDAWGLDDFDDSNRGPAFIDVVRFLGSLDLAARQRGWIHDREALWNRFFAGARRGLSNPNYQPPEPDIVRRLRKQTPVARTAYLAWADKQMQPMDEARLKLVAAAMQAIDRLVREERPNLAPGFFTVVHAGWLHMGVGSAVVRKVLIRVQGRTTSPDDDEVLEAKEVTNLEGIKCVESPGASHAVRIVEGTRQLARLTHAILAVGPTMLIPAAADRAEHWLEWWVTSWEPSYREVRLDDLRSVRDLSAIAYDAGVQLGAGESKDEAVRAHALMSLDRYEGRLKTETSRLVEELLAGWRELSRR